MVQNEQYTDVFLRLQSNYILIYIHDLKEYRLSDLVKLANQLEKSQTLDQSVEGINEELTRKSQYNVKERKKKKKEKKQAALHSNSQAKQKVLNELDSTLANQSDFERKWHSKYDIAHSIEGLIFDGKMFVNAKIGLQENKDIGSSGFIVSSEMSTSFIASGTLKDLNIPKKYIDPTIILYVQGKKQKFIVNEGENILGLDFLQEHKVLVSCNFRPDSCKCELTFTT